MANNAQTTPAHGFPPGLAQPALRALSAAGYTGLDQLAHATEASLKKLHGIGPKALDVLRSALAARGLAFADAGAPATPEMVVDSPTEWVKGHIQAYVQSDGQDGHQWRGMTTLLLTTRGRKSGILRRTALIYGRDGKNLLLVASNGGAPNHPAWYLNLVANPLVQIQVGAEKLTARARIADQHEKPRLWQVMTKVFPTYDAYQERAGREIPLVILEPVGA